MRQQQQSKPFQRLRKATMTLERGIQHLSAYEESVYPIHLKEYVEAIKVVLQVLELAPQAFNVQPDAHEELAATIEQTSEQADEARLHLAAYWAKASTIGGAESITQLKLRQTTVFHLKQLHSRLKDVLAYAPEELSSQGEQQPRPLHVINDADADRQGEQNHEEKQQEASHDEQQQDEK
jgi:hypothetical protein